MSYQQIIKERIEGGANEKAALNSLITALSFASISIFPGWTKRVLVAGIYGISIFLLFANPYIIYWEKWMLSHRESIFQAAQTSLQRKRFWNIKLRTFNTAYEESGL